MKKLLNAAFAYGLAGILAGLAYQLLLQVWCCPEYAPLAGGHSHLLVMGMLLFLVLCIVAVVAARVVFPKEVKEELHEELEELKEHGHHGHHPADKPEDDGKTEEK